MNSLIAIVAIKVIIDVFLAFLLSFKILQKIKAVKAIIVVRKDKAN